jgi:hypothetical protein
MSNDEPYFKIGDVVIFREHVYYPPFTPHYDRYKEHIFIVEKYYDEDDADELLEDGEIDSHLWLKCVSDPIIKLKGYVHAEDLIKVN